MYCKNCGMKLNENAVVCVSCGFSVGSGNKFCPNCGAETNPYADVCTKCGIRLAPSATGFIKKKSGILSIISLIWGVLAVLGMIIGFFPCLGALNWINIPFSLLGLILSIIALVNIEPEGKKGNAIAGIVLCSIAFLFGLIRLILGGGIV
jgi:ribosomal protein L40E